MKIILFSLMLLITSCGEEVSDVSYVPLKERCRKGGLCGGDIYTHDLLMVPYGVSVPLLRAYLLNKKNLSHKSPFKNTVAKIGGTRDLMSGLAYVMSSLKVNPIFALALSAIESGWGTSGISKDKYNLWGWRAYDGSASKNAMKFSSYTHGFSYVFARIKYHYLREDGMYYKRCKPPKRFKRYVRKAGCSDKHCGASLAGMNCKYSSDNSWAKKIRIQMNDITKFIDSYCLIPINPFGSPQGMLMTQVPRCG